jgi:hypothetical protein
MEQGALYCPIRPEDHWFVGTDKRFRFKITDDLGVVPADLATWDIEWFVRIKVSDALPVVQITAPDVDVVTADDPDNPGTDIEQVEVTFRWDDFDTLEEGEYQHALVRTDSLEVLAFGPAWLGKAAGP